MNDSVNGVYLPHSLNVKNNTEAYYREIHTREYYRNVYNRLSPNKNNKSAIESELKAIALELKNGTFKY